MPAARVLVVDDEPLARLRLRRLLEGRQEVRLVGEAGDGRVGVTAIRELHPDLVFLDVQMPDLDGFGVLAEVGPEKMPTVVFVTAFDEFALDAFEVSAVDYLLKPFEDERFEAALERALLDLHRRRSEELCERLACLVDGRRGGEASPPSRTGRRIAVHKGERIFFLPVADVDWMAAEGSYVRLHCGPRSHLVRDSLKSLERSLASEGFVRIHRSAMVQVGRVRELRPLFHGEYSVVLQDGTELKLSRSYRHSLHGLLSGP